MPINVLSMIRRKTGQADQKYRDLKLDNKAQLPAITRVVAGRDTW
ncbi:MAG: hypothetical protein ACFFD4_38540 [Candidatus Odinarchaeota archaeon]